MNDWLHYLGIEAKFLFAGLAGGLASLTKEKDLTFWQRVLTIAVGGFVAMYFTPVLYKILNLGDEAIYGIAFVIGYSGLRTVEWFLEKYFKKKNDE